MNSTWLDILMPVITAAVSVIAATVAVLLPKMARAGIHFLEEKTRIRVSESSENFLVLQAQKIATEIEERTNYALKRKNSGENIEAPDSDQKRAEFISRLMTLAASKGIVLTERDAEEFLAISLPFARTQ